MKKKILNALLMGVLVMTSMSVFVSCKDYDDDIDDLRLEQTDLLTQLESLKSNVESQTSSVTSQLSTLQSSLSSLDATLTSSINAAATAAQNAGSAAAAAQTSADEAFDAAEAAQATADEALAKAQEALTKASDTAAGEALTKAESALSQITELSSKLGSLETLNNGIAGLVEQVNKAATKEELKTLQASVNKYQNCFDNLFAMVTSVELYGTFTGSDAKLVNATKDDEVKDWLLELLHGKISENSTFGNDESYQKLADDQQISYEQGTEITGESGIIVRVNPVNATLSTESANCKILLVNSKGESLEDYVKIASVKKYDELITGTRATSINSGLWQIGIEFVPNVDLKEFAKAVINKSAEDNNNVTLYNLFAVAINNTDTANVDRYVASTYDLALDEKPYEPTGELQYTVTNSRGTTYVTDENDTDTKKRQIKNRYDNDVAAEYAWKKENGEYVTATTMYDSNGDPTGVVDDTDDNRSDKSLLNVEQGSEFTIALDDPDGKIDYYYVTLDKNFAESVSSPSEWAAWSSYEYGDNFLKTVKASEKLTLKVDSKTIDLNGEEVGFRVYAVNRDGTLVDPDGKAFYVEVGTPAGEREASGTITANETVSKNTVTLDLKGSSFNSYTTETSGTLEIDPDNSSAWDENGKIQYALIDKNGNVATNWKDATKVKITFNHPGYFEDGGTFVASKTIENGSTWKNNLKVTITKAMPTGIPTTLAFKAGQLNGSVYTCYLRPGADDAKWQTKVDEGTMDLVSAINGLKDQPNYKWTVADAHRNSNKQIEDLTVTSTDNGATYPLSVQTEFIDADKEHAVSVGYTYTGISYVKEKGEWLAKQDFSVTGTINGKSIIFSCILDKSVHDIKGWNQRLVKAATSTSAAVYEDVNVITYGDDDCTIDATKYLIVENSVDGKFSTWDPTKYLADGVSVTLVSDETGTVDYFDVQLATNVEDGTTHHIFKFVPKKGDVSSNPKADVPSKLHFKLTDAFDHTMEYDVPFTVKKR